MPEKIIQIDIYSSSTYEGLPHLRSVIYRSMAALDLLPCWDEHHPEQSSFKKKKRIPAVYINDKRIWDVRQPIGNFNENLIKAAIARAGRSGGFRFRKFLRMNFSFLLALGIAFFPKCPLCWAAYLSSLGLYKFSSITYQPWMLPVFIVLLGLNILSLYLTRKRHHYGPLLLSLGGSVLIVLNRFYFKDKDFIYLGIALMVVGALWNSLPRNMAISLRMFLFRLVGKTK